MGAILFRVSLFFSPRGGVSRAQIEPTFRKLDGPITDRFDCGEKDQNDFLLESAWRDQKEQYSFTHLAYVGGMLAGYASLAADSIELNRDERPASAPYARIAAVKLVQMGVDKRFQNRGLGEQLLNLAILHAQNRAHGGIGCRFLVLDALPHRVGYYAKRGFKVNEEARVKKLKRSKDKDPASVTVSMRFDLRDPGYIGEGLKTSTATSPSFSSRVAKGLGFAFEATSAWLRSFRR